MNKPINLPKLSDTIKRDLEIAAVAFEVLRQLAR